MYPRIYSYNPMSWKVVLFNSFILALVFFLIEVVIVFVDPGVSYLALTFVVVFYLLLAELFFIWYPFLRNEKQELELIITKKNMYILITSLNIFKKRNLQVINIDVTQLLYLEIMKGISFKAETKYKIPNDYYILQISQNNKKIFFVVPHSVNRGVAKSLMGLYEHFEFLPVQHHDPKVEKYHLILRTDVSNEY